MIENSLQAVFQFWENLTRYDLTEYFGKKIAQRGQDYANNGNVESVWITEDKNTILAVVNGEHTYETIVRIKLTGNSARIASQCTCPYGSQCKHGAAAIVAYLNLYAKKETVCTCKQISETHWELEMPDGKTIQREFDITKNGQSENESSESDNETLYQFLKQQLKQKSRKELAQYVLQLAKKYSSFREVIRKEYVAHSIAEISDADFLLQRAVGTIKKQTNNNQYQ